MEYQVEYQVEYHSNSIDGDVNEYIKKRIQNTSPEIWRIVSVAPIDTIPISGWIVAWSIEVPQK